MAALIAVRPASRRRRGLRAARQPRARTETRSSSRSCCVTSGIAGNAPILRTLDLPESVKDLLLRRLGGLDEECQKTLVIRRGCRARVRAGRARASAWWATRTEELVELLGRAIEAHVLVEEAGVLGRYRFAHPLIRETIYSDISTTGGRSTIGASPRRIESLYADRLAEQAGALALHYHAAGRTREGASNTTIWPPPRPSGRRAYEAAFEHLTGAIAAGELLGRSCAIEMPPSPTLPAPRLAGYVSPADEVCGPRLSSWRSMPLARLATARSRCRSSTGSACAGTSSTPSARSPATSIRSRSPRSSTTLPAQVSALNRLSLALRQPARPRVARASSVNERSSHRRALRETTMRRCGRWTA